MESGQRPMRGASRFESFSADATGRLPRARRMRSTLPATDAGYTHNGRSSTRPSVITSEYESWLEKPRRTYGEEKLVPRLLRGALAGLIATAPMTLSMILMHRYLPPSQQYPLPPRQLTDRLAKRTSTEQIIEDEQARALASHFAYGAAAGAIFGGMVKQPPLLSLLSGMGFGMAVWTASYAGWIPALGLLSPATEHPAQRNLLMIIANIIWGGITGLLTGLMNRK